MLNWLTITNSTYINMDMNVYTTDDTPTGLDSVNRDHRLGLALITSQN